MRAGQWLREQLLNDGPIRGMVGDQVFRLFLPEQFNRNAIVFRRRQTEHGQHTRGSDKLRRVTFQLHCLGTDDDTAEELAGAVITWAETLMPTLPRDFPDRTSPQIWVQRVEIEDEFDEGETIADAEGDTHPSIVIVIRIAHIER